MAKTPIHLYPVDHVPEALELKAKCFSRVKWLVEPIAYSYIRRELDGGGHSA